MKVKWSDNLEHRRIELLNQNLSYKDIADVLSNEFKIEISKKAVENRSWNTNTTKKDLIYFKDENNNEDNEDEIVNNQLFPEECYNIENEMCMSEEKLKELNKIYKKLTDLNPKKILSLSDLHSPFIDFKSIEKAILAHSDADICLLNGDILDLQSMSHFDKLKEIDLDIELKQTFDLLDVLTKKFQYIVWVGGNHDFQRFITFVSKNFASSMKKFVLQRLNPMDYIAEKYSNLIIVPHDWIEISDVVFAHLHNFNSADMKTVVNVNDIFYANKKLLPNPDYKAVIIGHTHHLGKIIKNGILLIEQGCLCHLMDYRFQKPVKSRWEKGYAVIYLKNNKVDFNKTNAIYIE